MNFIKMNGERRLLRVGYIKYKDDKDNGKVKDFISTDLDKYVEKLSIIYNLTAQINRFCTNFVQTNISISAFFRNRTGISL